jgi:alpha-galactosidase
MGDEEIAYTMVTGLSGRLYMSGFLNEMTADQLQLVHDAATLFKDIRRDIANAVPGWPIGLPDWYADHFALTLTTFDRTLVYVWHRGGGDAELTLRFGTKVRADQLLERYPCRLEAWNVADGPDGVVLRPGVAGPSARIYELAELARSSHNSAPPLA